MDPYHNPILARFPKITADEHTFLVPYIQRLPDDRAKEFVRVYNEARLDPQTFTILAALGFVFTSGMQRFYIGQWAVGLLYVFTCGVFFLGTIYDLVNGKATVLDVNRDKARDIYANYGNPYEVIV